MTPEITMTVNKNAFTSQFIVIVSLQFCIFALNVFL